MKDYIVGLLQLQRLFFYESVVNIAAVVLFLFAKLKHFKMYDINIRLYLKSGLRKVYIFIVRVCNLKNASLMTLLVCNNVNNKNKQILADKGSVKLPKEKISSKQQFFVVLNSCPLLNTQHLVESGGYT